MSQQQQYTYISWLHEQDESKLTDADLLMFGDEALAAIRAMNVIYHPSKNIDQADFVILKNACFDCLADMDLFELEKLNDSARTERSLREIGENIRQRIEQKSFSEKIRQEIEQAFEKAKKTYGANTEFRVNGSASSFDMPLEALASLAHRGPVHTLDELLALVKRCYLALFTDESIKYRADRNLQHDKAAVAVMVQKDTAKEAMQAERRK